MPRLRRLTPVTARSVVKQAQHYGLQNPLTSFARPENCAAIHIAAPSPHRTVVTRIDRTRLGGCVLAVSSPSLPVRVQ